MNRRELLRAGAALLTVMMTPAAATALKCDFRASELNDEAVTGRRIVNCNIVCDEDLILLDGDVFEGCNILCEKAGILCVSEHVPATIRGCSITVSPPMTRESFMRTVDGTPMAPIREVAS